MVELTIKDELLPIVDKYGYELVDRTLREIGSSRQSPEYTRGGPKSRGKAAAPRLNAPEYVAKMVLPSEKGEVLTKLARSFNQKTFLTTFGEISNFCSIYGIDEPASKSRASAIPRVFKSLAQMEVEDLHRMLDDGMFSGPSRLGPIADAIRLNGRASRR